MVYYWQVKIMKHLHSCLRTNSNSERNLLFFFIQTVPQNPLKPKLQLIATIAFWFACNCFQMSCECDNYKRFSNHLHLSRINQNTLQPLSLSRSLHTLSHHTTNVENIEESRRGVLPHNGCYARAAFISQPVKVWPAIGVIELF